MNKVLFGDNRETLKTLPDRSVQMCVTSPPYFGLRSYLPESHYDKHLEIGAEKTPDEFITALVGVFREVRRVLADDGVIWVNIGDSYAGSWGDRGRSEETNAPRSDLEEKYGTTATSRNGFSHLGIKPKDLIGIPWMLAFALRADGWYLRQDIVWSKPNPMPESVTDRCSKSHEYIFMLSKSARYYYDNDAIKEPMSMSSVARLSQDIESQRGSDRVPGKTNGTMKAVGGDKQRGHSRRHAGFNDRWAAMEKADQCSGMRNKRSVWTVATQPYSGAHFATFPAALIEPCILAGSRVGDIVLDPFMGSGTTAQVSEALGRKWIGCELNSAYEGLQQERTAQMGMALA